MDEGALLSQLRTVEALFAPAGEAGSVDRCRAQLVEWRKREADIEYQCSVSGAGQVVLAALCVRYGIEPYRRSRRSRTTCLRAPREFVRVVLWPQFEAMTEVIECELALATRRVMESWAGTSLGAIEADEAQG